VRKKFKKEKRLEELQRRKVTDWMVHGFRRSVKAPGSSKWVKPYGPGKSITTPTRCKYALPREPQSHRLISP
jgi:hypothetical protein